MDPLYRWHKVSSLEEYFKLEELARKEAVAHEKSYLRDEFIPLTDLPELAGVRYVYLWWDEVVFPAQVFFLTNAEFIEDWDFNEKKHRLVVTLEVVFGPETVKCP